MYMPITRVLGLLMLALVFLTFTVHGLGRVFIYGSFVTAAACVVNLAATVRKGRRVRALLAWASLSAVLYIGGGLYVLYWSPPTDIGGGLPFVLGVIGIVTVALNLSWMRPDESRTR